MGDSFIFDDDETRQSSFSDMPEGDMPEGGEDGAPGGSNNRTFLIAAGIIGGVILLALLCMAGYAFFLLPRQSSGQAAAQTAVLLTNTAIAGGATSTAQALMATATLDSGSIAATAQAVAATRQMEATRTAEALAALASPTPVVVQATATPILANLAPGTKFVYTIQPGDTLELIAAKFNSTVEEILALQENQDAGITDASQVIAGVTIVIPVNTVAAAADPVTQTVAALYTQAALAELTVFPTSTALGDVPATGFADEVGLPGLFIIGFVLVVIILLARRLRSAPQAR